MLQSWLFFQHGCSGADEQTESSADILYLFRYLHACRLVCIRCLDSVHHSSVAFISDSCTHLLLLYDLVFWPVSGPGRQQHWFIFVYG